MHCFGKKYNDEGCLVSPRDMVWLEIRLLTTLVTYVINPHVVSTCRMGDRSL